MTKSLSLRFQGRIWTFAKWKKITLSCSFTRVGLHSKHLDVAHWFVFDGGTGHTQVELAVLLHAGVDQGLDRGLLLEEQEGVAWREEEAAVILQLKVRSHH